MYVLIFTIFMSSTGNFSDMRGTVSMPFKSMEECRAAESRMLQMFAFDNFRINTRCVITDAFERKPRK